MAKRTDPRNTTMQAASTPIRIALTCAAECGWLLLSLLGATLFLAAFVLLAEPVQAGTIGDALASPVNVIRLVVLTASLWLSAYIARAVRSVGAKPVRDDDAMPRRDDTRQAGSLVPGTGRR